MLSHPLANQKAVCIELQQVDYRERLFHKFNIIFSLKRQVPGYKKVFCKSPVKRFFVWKKIAWFKGETFFYSNRSSWSEELDLSILEDLWGFFMSPIWSFSKENCIVLWFREELRSYWHIFRSLSSSAQRKIEKAVKWQLHSGGSLKVEDRFVHNKVNWRFPTNWKWLRPAKLNSAWKLPLILPWPR